MSTVAPSKDHHQVKALRDSIKEPERFWAEKADLLTWSKKYDKVLNVEKKNGEVTWDWFAGGELSTCYNAIDRHVENGRGDKVAIDWVSVATNDGRKITYASLLEQVQIFAGVLRSLGVKKGNTVLIYMPMVPEALVAMCACSRLGAVHSVVFGGFAAKELAKRIEDAKPNVIVTASCGIEPKGPIAYKPMVDAAVEKFSSHKPAHTILLQRKQLRAELNRGELDYHQACDKIRQENKAVKECVSVGAADPIYTLYTSGTTGLPKGVERQNGGHAVALRFTMEYLFGMKQDDVFWCASDIGWVVGHSYICYGPLLLGCTTILFEGKPILPDAGIFWKVIQDHKVNALFTAPTALRAIRREDDDASLMRKSNIRSLRALFLAGERSEPGIITLYQKLLTEQGAKNAIVIDNYWSTESGSPISAICNTANPLTPRPGSAGIPMPGMDVHIVDDEGKEVNQGDMGNVVMKPPLGPSVLHTLWHNHANFQKSYMKRYKGKGDWFDTGDAGMIDQDGYLHVMSRTDDIINTAGHRLSTGSIEQVVTAHPAVAECCVVGIPDKTKGHVPIALVSLSHHGGGNAEEIRKAINDHVRNDIGSIASLAAVIVAPGGKLPKTRSGKTIRKLIRNIVEHAVKGQEEYELNAPPTIEDIEVAYACKQTIHAYFAKAKM